MRFSTCAIRLVALTSIWLGSATSLPNPGTNNPPEGDEVITRDVAIIGGGSSGTYAAVRLQELGQSVILIERKGRLGGHTETYYDPSGTPIDYGVWVYSNSSVATRYFDYLNIPVTSQIFDRDPGRALRVDLRTGEPVAPHEGDMAAAMARYASVLSQHPYLADGWDLPHPVPEDLLLPFQEFIMKYDLGAAVELLTIYVQGYADILNYPAVYVLKYFNMNVVLGGQFGFQRPASLANSDIYKSANKILGDNVLLSSKVEKMQRPSNNSDTHSMIVTTPSGRKQIRAKKLIIAMPPLPENLKTFDLDAREYNIFSKFQRSGYYTNIVRLTGLPPGLQILNQAVDTPYNVAPMPGTYILYPSAVQDLYVTFFGGGNGSLPREEMQERLTANILTLRNDGYNVSEPEFIKSGDHYPFGLHVSAEEIRKGFYRDLSALQGYRGTYYTGAAFHEHDSGALWKFTEGVIGEYIRYPL